MRTGVVALVAFGVAGYCWSAPAPQQGTNQMIRQDLDKAALIVIAEVEAVKDGAMRPGPAGYRPVEITLQIKRVLKGHSDLTRACFVYMAPYGGYHGPASAWVEHGATGVFALAPGNRCFRAVNDARAIIPVTKIPNEPSTSREMVIADATLPTRSGCSSGTYQAAAEVRAVSIPLIGSRSTRRLLERTMSDPDARTRDCSCLVIALVWRLDEKCISAISSTSSPAEVNLIRAENRRLLQTERDWLAAAPLEWLKMAVSSWGLDGTLLRLGYITSDVKVTTAACNAFAQGLASGALDRELIAGVSRSTESTEAGALAQFKQWLSLNCDSSYAGLQNPAALLR